MIFKQLDELLDGRKTQTRRLVLPGECALNYWRQPLGTPTRIGTSGEDTSIGIVLSAKGRTKFQVSNQYAIVPKMGKPAIPTHRIHLTDIRREDVREISDEDAFAEGVSSNADYLALWTSIYDPSVRIWWEDRIGGYMWATGRVRTKNEFADTGNYSDLHRFLYTRPAERYQAWALTFALVQTEKAVQS